MLLRGLSNNASAPCTLLFTGIASSHRFRHTVLCEVSTNVCNRPAPSASEWLLSFDKPPEQQRPGILARACVCHSSRACISSIFENIRDNGSGNDAPCQAIFSSGMCMVGRESIPFPRRWKRYMRPKKQTRAREGLRQFAVFTFSRAPRLHCSTLL